MDRTRREFVKTAAVASAGVALASVLPASPKPAPLKILILGGTAFLGPQIVEAARARGHVLTLFNRGKTNPGLFNDGNFGFTQVSCAKAIAAGLVFRPVSVTAKDTLAWYETLPENRRKELQAGITMEEEAKILAAWHASKGG